MKIIDNITPNNHLVKVTAFMKDSDEIVIASPFLMSDFTKFLNSVEIKPKSKIKIITTLHPKSPDQPNKVGALLSIVRHPALAQKSVDISIAINNNLHGKIYLFKSNGLVRGIISSANFTNKGLASNHEWGVEIEDVEVLSKIWQDLEKTIEIENISTASLETLYYEAQKYLKNNPPLKQEINLDLISLLPKNKTKIYTGKNYWLKPIGVSEDPVPTGRKFDALEQKLNFSKRPSSVEIGDILIAYGVGVRRILSIYRIASTPSLVTQEEIAEVNWLERWPWYVIGENLTPDFGREWWKHGLNPFQLEKVFKTVHPEVPITAKGTYTLGRLNFGHDKVDLKREFAEFLVGKIVEANKKVQQGS